MHDPMHMWFLGTGRDLAGSGIHEIARRQPATTVAGRLKQTHMKFIAYSRRHGIFPAIPRFGLHLNYRVSC